MMLQLYALQRLKSHITLRKIIKEARNPAHSVGTLLRPECATVQAGSQRNSALILDCVYLSCGFEKV